MTISFSVELTLIMIFDLCQALFNPTGNAGALLSFGAAKFSAVNPFPVADIKPEDHPLLLRINSFDGN